MILQNSFSFEFELNLNFAEKNPKIFKKEF